MGFRFFKRVKIAPGISLNLSKTGISTSVGVPGARVTFGNGKTRTTVGLPGTGLSHTTIETDKPEDSQAVVYAGTEKSGFAATVMPWARMIWPTFVKVAGFLLLIAVAFVGIFASIILSASKKKGRRSPD